ncbi:MAG: GNAT family N-acetyltransferase [Candidatus Hodarchaeales archaeon]|jgi:GNAT superfamily N-acetyltransferase
MIEFLSNDKTKNSNFLSVANQNQAQFAFQLYRVLTHPEKVKIYQIEEQPNTFVYIYKHYLTTYGHKGTIEDILNKLTKTELLETNTRYEITFQHHHLPSIRKFFGDFDIIEELGGSGEFNHLIAIELNKTNFTPKRLLKSGKRIKSDLLDHFDPELKELVENGYVYGIIQDTELISVCPIPFIYKNELYSFAILHQIFTAEAHRQKGFATGSTRSALNFIFTRQIIKAAYAWVDEDNPAVHMFEKMGFEQAGHWIGTRCFLS